MKINGLMVGASVWRVSALEVIPLRNEAGQPLEFVGVNPWEEPIAQVAAEGPPEFS